MSSEAARFPSPFLGDEIGDRRTQISDVKLIKPASISSNTNANTHEAISSCYQDARSAQPSDEVVFFRICAGDREALGTLFRRYARLVRAVGLRILRDEAEADDLLQEVFLFIHRKCRHFDSAKGSVRSWIVQITYHRAIDRRRYLASRHFYTRLDIEEAAVELSDPRTEMPAYDQSLDGVLGKGSLERLSRLLSDDQLATLRLYFFEGYSLEEIAAHLGQSIGNVRNHYYRGLERVRRELFGKKLRAE